MIERGSERVMRIVEAITKRTAAEHYRLVLNEERKPVITGSKIGGIPYWPAGKDFPVDEQGQKMLMLLQINCAEAGLKAPLPEKGILQWFISTNPERMYGCQGNYAENGCGFAVIYHDEVTVSTTPPDNAPTHQTIGDELTPVKREVAIDVVLEETVMGVSDGRFNDLFFDIVKEITGLEHTDKMWYDYLDNDDCMYLERHLGMKPPRHQMLGYPAFDQDDARRDIDTYDVLLLQLASQYSDKDRKELVMWGDMGNGFVFINHEDLRNLDFSHTYYCWDCG